jgi:hypothetical protein
MEARLMIRPDDVVAYVFFVVLVGASVALMAACATDGVRPVAVQVRTVEVDKPVPVPCVAASDIPAPTPTTMPAPPADVARLAAGAYVDMHHLVVENAQLRALLIQCTKGATP